MCVSARGLTESDQKVYASGTQAVAATFKDAVTEWLSALTMETVDDLW